MLPCLVFGVTNTNGIRIVSIHFNGQIDRHLFENGQQRVGLHPLPVRNIILGHANRLRSAVTLIHARGLPLAYVREYYDPVSRSFVFRGVVLISQSDETLWFRNLPIRRAVAQQRRAVTLRRRRELVRQHVERLVDREPVPNEAEEQPHGNDEESHVTVRSGRRRAVVHNANGQNSANSNSGMANEEDINHLNSDQTLRQPDRQAVLVEGSTNSRLVQRALGEMFPDYIAQRIVARRRSSTPIRTQSSSQQTTRMGGNMRTTDDPPSNASNAANNVQNQRARVPLHQPSADRQETANANLVHRNDQHETADEEMNFEFHPPEQLMSEDGNQSMAYMQDNSGMRIDETNGGSATDTLASSSTNLTSLFQRFRPNDSDSISQYLQDRSG